MDHYDYDISKARTASTFRGGSGRMGFSATADLIVVQSMKSFEAYAELILIEELRRRIG